MGKTIKSEFYCEKCQESLNTRNSLIAHNWRKHRNEPKVAKKVTCEVCGKEFKSGKALGGHTRVHQTKIRTCVTCGAEFDNVGKLSAHVRELHPRVEYHRTCIMCPTKFSTYNIDQECCSIQCFNQSPKKQLSCKSHWSDRDQPWNKGLTGEVNEKIAKNAKANSERLTGMSAVERYGEETAARLTTIKRKNGKDKFASLSAEEKIQWMAATRTEESNDKRNIANTGFRKTIYGTYYSEKNKADIRFDSSYELLACMKFEKDPTVAKYGRCRFGINYFIDGEVHRYYPDFVVEYVTGVQAVIEVKPDTQLSMPKNVAKRLAAVTYCKENNLDFIVLTEKDLFQKQNYISIHEGRKSIAFSTPTSEKKFETFFNKTTYGMELSK